MQDTETFKYVQINTGNYSLYYHECWQHQQPKLYNVQKACIDIT